MDETPGSANQSEPPGDRPAAPAPATPDSATSTNRLWLIALIGAIAIFAIAFFVGRATQGDEVAEETSTTLAARARATAPILVLSEADDGRTVQVAPGWIVALRLGGRADPAYAWNLEALNRDLFQSLPGPQVTYLDYQADDEAVFTYSALALSEGEVQVSGEYVTPEGEAEKSFQVTVQIVAEEDLSATTTSEAEQQAETTEPAPETTEAPTTTDAPTTTEASATTTTEASTTTTVESGTTTSTGAPGTTGPPTTTPPSTEPPTTAPPSTEPPTTEPPTTTTTVLPLPPLPPDTVVLGPKANGQVTLASLSTAAVVLALPDDPASGYAWELQPIDESVLQQQGEPEFVPGESGSGPGARVWRFDVIAEEPAVAVLEANYAGPDGRIVSHFYTTLAFEAVPAALPY